MVNAGLNSDLPDQIGAPSNRTAHRITMTADVFGDGMHHQINAQRVGVHSQWGQEGGVAANQRADLVCHFADGGQIGQAQDRVNRGFGVNQPGVRAQCRSDRIQV